jgi:hypothetical protein
MKAYKKQHFGNNFRKKLYYKLVFIQLCPLFCSQLFNVSYMYTHACIYTCKTYIFYVTKLLVILKVKQNHGLYLHNTAGIKASHKGNMRKNKGRMRRSRCEKWQSVQMFIILCLYCQKVYYQNTPLNPICDNVI